MISVPPFRASSIESEKLEADVSKGENRIPKTCHPRAAHRSADVRFADGHVSLDSSNEQS